MVEKIRKIVLINFIPKSSIVNVPVILSVFEHDKVCNNSTILQILQIVYYVNTLQITVTTFSIYQHIGFTWHFV